MKKLKYFSNKNYYIHISLLGNFINQNHKTDLYFQVKLYTRTA